MDLREMLDSDFRGAAYIVQDNKVLCEKVSGFADLPNEIPNSTDTKFASASAGKVFVAVGILQLIEQGRLNIHDVIGNILDIDLHSIDKNVTIEQLLNHTSGVPDYERAELLKSCEASALFWLGK